MLFRLLLALTLSAFAAVSQAALVITVQDASIQVGGTGFVDVRITSDGTDAINLFGYEFLIEDDGTNNSDLRFTEFQMLDEQGAFDYVLGNNTDEDSIFSDPRNSPSFNRIEGGDGTPLDENDEPVDVTVASTDDFLLARLELTHFLPGGTPASSAIGDNWTISLQNSGLTFFDGQGTPPTVDFSKSVSGTITATAVPEPSSIALLAVMGVAGIARRSRRKRASYSAAQCQGHGSANDLQCRDR